MSFLTTWLTLAALWIGLSGYYDAIHLGFGFVSVTLVSLLSHRHLTDGSDVGRGVGRFARTLFYAPWLLWKILLANLDVLLRVFGLRPVDPRVIEFEPDLSCDYGRVLLANSITLTPGTVTVKITDGKFIVHALSPEAAQDLVTGEMEHRVRWVEGPRRARDSVATERA